MSQIRVLVTGASGYVGGRLVPALLAASCDVCCLARTPAKLDRAPWCKQVEVVRGDVGGDIQKVIQGMDVAVYLVHSIGRGRGWAAQEIRDARNFAKAAADARIRRIVYLGGLGSDSDTLSQHLQSRHDVGHILASTGVDVVELRAGVIIGSGSASFEMLRYLVEVLPVMVTPRWVETKCQPVAISDVIRILTEAITRPHVDSGVYETGGPDVVTYAQMMELYAEAAGLAKRRLIRVPLLTPGLSSHWVGLVTPVPVPLARELVESLINEVTVQNRSASDEFAINTMPLRVAMKHAMAATNEGSAATSFSDADLVVFRPTTTDPKWSGGTVLKDVRTGETRAKPEAVFASILAIGGAKGYYSGDWLWRIRGVLDQLAGGPGLRRGRRTKLSAGEPLDFWRVEELTPRKRFRLRAEMRLPGEAYLTWDIEPTWNGTRVTQTALFRPRGLLGRAYWLLVAPFHRYIFPGMLAGLLAEAESKASST